MFRAMGGRYGDFRDWDVIDAWAAEIAQDLQGD
jgi:menaquinone-dependent protoporphyrinogen oxidase